MGTLRERIKQKKERSPQFSQAPPPAPPTETTPHEAILGRLLNELRPIDLGDCSTRVKVVLTVETILETAKANYWQLCRNNGTFYLYNGEYWQPLDRERLEQFLGQAAENLGVPPVVAKYFKFRSDLLRQFETSAILPRPTTQPDKVQINLTNGTFEFSATGTALQPFDPVNFINYQLPFDYDETATSPIFQAYLERVLPDIERQKVLAEFMGYVFIRHGSRLLKEEKALILYGSGANGKSVFFEVVTALLGTENVSHYSLASLTEEKGFYRSQIEHKLLNYCSEISTKLEASMFKNLVSGEPVEVSHKYGQPYTMRDYAKLVFNSNELPKDVEHSHAFFRRFLIVPFDQTIPDDQQDKTLHSKIIQNELSGVFNWVLSGLRRLLDQQGFTDCQASREALDQYRTESDSVRMFLQDTTLKPDSIRSTKLKDLYPEYRRFCQDDGFKPYSKRNFKKRLERSGVVVGREGGTGQVVVYLAEPLQTMPF